jgi:hypothetical protein
MATGTCRTSLGTGSKRNRPNSQDDDLESISRSRPMSRPPESLRRLAPFPRGRRSGSSLLAALLRFFAAVLWQVKVDEAKAGGSWMRLVNPHNAVLVTRAGANFVIRGGVCVVANLYLTAGEPAARDSEGANRFAVVTLEHLPVTGEWLAIVLSNLEVQVEIRRRGDQSSEDPAVPKLDIVLNPRARSYQ